MQPNNHLARASKTAEGTAASRAVESLRSPHERVIYDPYAKLLLSEKLQKLIDKPFLVWLMGLFSNFKLPGLHNSVIARVRFMNECIKECFPNDCTQLVILGAGYDMSAYCFRDILKDAKVFEVDHPNTQKEKLDKIHSHLNDAPTNITYIPLNFDTDDLKDSLIANGYDPTAKTLFLWEGVTYFLEKESIIQTLRFIVKNSAPQSKVAFDYYPPEVVNGTSTDKTGKEMYKLVNKLGEPYKFGMKVYDMEPFLITQGFTQINKLSTDQIKQTYFHGNNKKRKVTHNFNFVCATT